MGKSNTNNFNLPTNMGYGTNYFCLETKGSRTLKCHNPHCEHHYKPMRLTMSQIVYYTSRPKRAFCSYNCRSHYKKKYIDKID